MGIGTHGRVGAFVAAALLAACGGDDGGDNTVPLKTEADVSREISNIYGLAQGTSSSGGAAPSRTGIRPAMQARKAHMLAAPGASPRPKAETIQCGSGSYVYDFATNTPRELPLFEVNTAVDYESYDGDDCTDTEGSWSQTLSGFQEFGDNYAYGGGSGASPIYDYYVAGRNGGSFEHVVRDVGFEATVRERGRSEYRDIGTSIESREVLYFSYVFEVDVEGDRFREEISLGAGESGNPLVIVDDTPGNTFTIDGPFSYRFAEVCDGGRIVYDTVQPLNVSSDSEGVFLNAGQITLTSGGATVSLTFQADGDVTYSIDGGGSGEVTRAELQAEPGCGLFVDDSGGA